MPRKVRYAARSYQANTRENYFCGPLTRCNSNECVRAVLAIPPVLTILASSDMHRRMLCVP